MSSHQWRREGYNSVGSGRHDFKAPRAGHSNDGSPDTTDSATINHNTNFKSSNTINEKAKSNHQSPYNADVREYGEKSSQWLKQNEREVDYYENPTELFRWINYRKWEGARARVKSNPEECATWVISRHSADGRILWRNLPLHLVCMQIGGIIDAHVDVDEMRDVSDSNHPLHTEKNQQYREKAFNLQQLEKLVEEVLFAYPDAAMTPDDQGMLPLHLCITNTNDSKRINERILLLLLTAHPAGLRTRDSNGKTPMDLFVENKSVVPKSNSALRIMQQATLMVESIVESVHQEATRNIKTVVQRSENERRASQRIIERLEDELAEEQRRAEKENSSAGEIRVKSSALQEELHMSKKQYESIKLDLDQVKKERDELIATNNDLTEKLDEQEDIVAEIKRHADEDSAKRHQIVSTLKSEANTARAMVDAVENQLRTKFSNELDLKNTVDNLECKVAVLNSTYQKEKKNLQIEVDRLKEENTSTESAKKDLTTKNKSLLRRNNELSKNLEEILFIYSAMASEYDKLLDSSKRYELRTKETTQTERTYLLSTVIKQQKIFQAALDEQKEMMEDSTKKELELEELIDQERKKQQKSVEKIKSDYQSIRTHVSSQELKTMKQDNSVSHRLAPSPGMLHGGYKQIRDEVKMSTIPKNNSHVGNTSSFRKESGIMDEELTTDSDSDASSFFKFLDQKSKQQQSRLSSAPIKSSYQYTQTSKPTNEFEKLQYVGEVQDRIRSSLLDSKENTNFFNLKAKESTSDVTPQKSFSLDKFSDYGSKHTSCTDSVNNDYAGMSSAIKKGMIRVNPTRNDDLIGGRRQYRSELDSNQQVKAGSHRFTRNSNSEPSSMEAIRKRYFQQKNKYSVTDEYGEDLISMTSNESDIVPLSNRI